MSMVQSIIPPERRSEGTGYFALGTTLSAAIGPAFSLFIVNQFSYNALFWETLIISIIGLIAAIVVYVRSNGMVGSGGPVKFTLGSVFNPQVIPISIFMLIIAFAYSGIMTYINPYATERDLLPGAGLFFIAYAIVMFISRPYLGRLQDQKGDNVVITIGLVSFVIALAIMAVATQNWHVVVAGVINGVGFGALMPAAQSITVRKADRREFGSALSTFFLMVDLGFGVGPVVLGAAFGVISFQSLYLILGAVVVFAGIYYALVHGRTYDARRVA